VVRLIAYALKIILPFIDDNFKSIAPVVLLITFFLMALLLSLIGKNKRIGLLCLFAFALYLPSVQPFSKIDWLYFIGIRNTLETASPLIQTLLNGIIIMFCYVSLVCLARIRETKNELTQRGGKIEDIDMVIKSQITINFTILLLAAVVTSLACVLLIVGESTVSALIIGVEGLGLILGVGSSAILLGFVYYYLKRNNE
jgi:hypothetical protein